VCLPSPGHRRFSFCRFKIGSARFQGAKTPGGGRDHRSPRACFLVLHLFLVGNCCLSTG
jgi:hypothetical protein